MFEMITSPSAIDSPSLSLLNQQKSYYKYDIGGQRSYVWDLKRKSQLIISLFENVQTGIITANINGQYIEVADGQQRLNTIFSYLNNEFALENHTVLRLNLDGSMKSYDFSNMKYKELPDIAKITLMSRNVRIEKYMNLTDSQLNTIMVRLNNGKPLTTVERTRMEFYGSIGNFVTDICNNELFTRKIWMTDSSKKRFNHEALVYSILAIECGIEDEVSLSNYQKVGQTIMEQGLLTEEIKGKIITTMAKMDKVFPARDKILSSKNIISLYLFIGELEFENGREVFEKLTKIFGDKEFNDKLDSKSRNTSATIKERVACIKEYYESA